jgi:hypothetical protein
MFLSCSILERRFPRITSATLPYMGPLLMGDCRAIPASTLAPQLRTLGIYFKLLSAFWPHADEKYVFAVFPSCIRSCQKNAASPGSRETLTCGYKSCRSIGNVVLGSESSAGVLAPLLPRRVTFPSQSSSESSPPLVRCDRGLLQCMAEFEIPRRKDAGG